MAAYCSLIMRSDFPYSQVEPRGLPIMQHILCHVIDRVWAWLCDIISLSHSDVSTLETELQRITAALLDEFLEPEKNNLIRRCV